MDSDLGSFDFSGGGGRVVFVAKALLEALDALREVAHQLRQFAATEQQQDQDYYECDVPETESHDVSPVAPLEWRYRAIIASPDEDTVKGL
jgi:hypothetical protein